METFANAFYYFCKFQSGQPEFWVSMEQSLNKNKESLTVEQLTRCLLALVMNPRPIEQKLADGVINGILNKFDKAGSKDVFYLCIALGKGMRKLPQESVSTDIYYAIYLKSLQVMSEYDLYQISQIGNFMSGPGVSRNIPDEFWTGCLESALDESLKEFTKYSELISKENYMDDYMSCLVSFGIRGVASKKL